MAESVIHIEASQSPGFGRSPTPFAELVDRFCLEQAEFRAWLFRAGEGGNNPQPAPIRDPGARGRGPRGCGPRGGSQMNV